MPLHQRYPYVNLHCPGVLKRGILFPNMDGDSGAVSYSSIVP